jgi:hypothetical protein
MNTPISRDRSVRYLRMIFNNVPRTRVLAVNLLATGLRESSRRAHPFAHPRKSPLEIPMFAGISKLPVVTVSSAPEGC